MLHLVEVDESQWRQGDVSHVANLLDEVGRDPARARRVRGTIDLRFSNVEEDNAYDNSLVIAYLSSLYGRAPSVAYFVAPTDEQFIMFMVSHGGWVEGEGENRSLHFGSDTEAALKVVLLAAAVYSVEHGDDWLQVVEPWAARVDPHFAYEVREALAKEYDRHDGLRLTAAGWVSCAD